MAIPVPLLLARKRDGLALPSAEIEGLVRGIVERTLDAAQIGALAMAVRLRGMDEEETVALTRAMADSGERLRWPRGAPLLDKHSTGGVGDCTSLLIAPLLAACGARVPMLSGRGLGHTGGTLDKLESIPGYRCQPQRASLRRVLRDAGCAIVGSGPRLAPADRRLYAVRDVTATVDSIPLIVASILSKKLAAGVDVLVLDVKQGHAAFLPDAEQAAALARTLHRVAARCGLRTRVLRTDMSQPLASAVGNALELREALRVLAGEARESRLCRLSLRLAAEALCAAGMADSLAAAELTLQRRLDSGEAAQRFAAMVHGLGGPADLLERPDAYFAPAPVRLPVAAPAAGFLQAWQARELGEAVVALGGGRYRQDQAIDHRVGLAELLEVGAAVTPGQPLAVVHAADHEAAAAAAAALLAALRLSQQPVAPAPLIHAAEGD